MKILAALTAAAMLALPGLATACNYHEQHAQMSCAEGMVYDDDTRSCVQPTG